MSDKKTLVERLEAFVAKHKAMFADLPPAQNPSEYTLADGSKVTIDKLEIGGVVKLADGTLAPAGELALADGSTITITDGGVIGGIETKAVEDAEPAMEDMKKQCMELNAKVGEMLSQFSDVLKSEKHDFSSQQTEVKQLKETVAKQGVIIKEMFEVLAQFSEAKPIVTPKQPLFEPKADKVAKFVESQLKK